MPFQNDQFGHKTYVYEPKWEKDVERSSDKQPSHSAMYIEDRGADVVWVLQVRGLGALMFRSDGAKSFHGMSSFSDDDIQFEKEYIGR